MIDALQKASQIQPTDSEETKEARMNAGNLMIHALKTEAAKATNVESAKAKLEKLDEAEKKHNE